MQTLIVAVIVIVAAVALVARLRAMFRPGEGCACGEAKEEGGQCGGCAGRCYTATTSPQRPPRECRE